MIIIANSEALTMHNAHRQNADLPLEASAGHFHFNRNKVDNPIQPSSQQYCYRFLDCAKPRLSESNACVSIVDV